MARTATLVAFTVVVICLLPSVTECGQSLKPGGSPGTRGTQSTGGNTVGNSGSAKTKSTIAKGETTTTIGVATTKATVSDNAQGPSTTVGVKTSSAKVSNKAGTTLARARTTTTVGAKTPSDNVSQKAGTTLAQGKAPTTVGAKATKVTHKAVTTLTHDRPTTTTGATTTSAKVSAKTRTTPIQGKTTTNVGYMKPKDTATGSGNTTIEVTVAKTNETTSIDPGTTHPTTLPTHEYVHVGTMTASVNVWPMLMLGALKVLVSYNTTQQQKPLLDLLTGVLKNQTYFSVLEDVLENIFVPENGTREQKLLEIMNNIGHSPYVKAIGDALKPVVSKFEKSPQSRVIIQSILAGHADMEQFNKLLDIALGDDSGHTGQHGGGNTGFPDLSGIMSIVGLFRNNATGFKQLMQMLPLVLEAPLQKLGISKDCHDDIYTMLGGIGTKQQWALRMIDAFGKPGSELLNFQFKWMGSYDECVALKGMPWTAEPGRRFNGQYCQTDIPITAIKLPPAGRALMGGDNPVITLGTCVSSSCSDSDVTAVIKAVASLFGTDVTSYKTAADCKVEKNIGDHPGVIAVICILALLGTCMVIGTAYDVIVVQMNLFNNGGRSRSSYSLGDQHIDPYEMKGGVVNGGYVKAVEAGEGASETAITANGTGQSMVDYTPHTSTSSSDRGVLGQILLSFSIYTNGVKILNTKQASGSLGAVNGVRFLSMAWVIFGHTYFFTSGYDDNLLQHVFQKMNDWTFMALPFATVSVDSFFTLSGLLVGYLTLREMKKLGGARKLNWVMYYFHRIWRLTPTYMLVLMVAIMIVPYLSMGPQWPMTDGPWVATCRKYWWTNLLYINNLVHVDKLCLGWSWYLSNDMQFYVLSPFLLLPLFYHVAAGIASCGLFLGTTVIMTAYFVHKGNYSPQIINQYAYKATDGNWNSNVYVPCYTRMGPYVIGMFTGYLLYRCKCKYRMPKILVLAGWITCLFITTSIIYGLYSDGDKHILAPPAGTAYQVLFRPGWGIALSWIIFACATGNGGWINELLSWKPFVPLGRLSYVAYLIHPIVMLVFYRSRRNYTHFTDYETAYLFIGHLVITYGASFILSLAFEAPWMGLEKAIFKRDRRS